MPLKFLFDEEYIKEMITEDLGRKGYIVSNIKKQDDVFIAGVKTVNDKIKEIGTSYR